MQHALFPSRLDDLDLSTYDRLYWGAEFCCWRMPGPKSIRLALDIARQQGCQFTLVTPVLVESFIPRLRLILDEVVPLLKPQDEVVASDLGTIGLLREQPLLARLVVGRALSGQKRGPRILDLDLGEEEQEYFRSGAWYNHGALEYLRERRIQRVELDNLLQGIKPLPAGLRGSLHLPYVMVTSSRNCPFNDQPLQPCRPRCGEVMRLNTDQTAVSLLQAGNTQFLENHRLPANLPLTGIDRLVQHQRLPA